MVETRRKLASVSRSELAASRFRLLLRQLGEEGLSQREIAKRVGVSQGAISFYVTGQREPQTDTLAGAMDRVPLRSEFFFDAALGEEPYYRDFIGARLRVELDHVDTPAWLELVELGWLERYKRRGLSEAQIEYARRTLFRGAPSVDDYVDVLEAMVRALARPEAPEMAAARAKSERDGTPSAKHWVPTPPEDDPGPAPKGRKKAKR